VGETHPKPLAGKRVVVTRALEQSHSLVAALREAGGEAVVLPLVAFAAADNPAELDGYLKGSKKFDWVMFTSQNAVRALQERCETLGVPVARVFSGVSVAAVGPATAESALAAGLSVSYVSRVHNGVALAEELAGQLAGKHIFLPRSDRANPELVEVLQRSGAQVTSVVAYKTVSPNEGQPGGYETLLRHAPDAILLFSPSAVHHLQELLGLERLQELGGRTVFVAIGPVTEKALMQNRLERVLLAPDTTVSATIAVLSEYFSKAGQRQPAGAKQG
jgi:uroporphyrinogen-III synthase